MKDRGRAVVNIALPEGWAEPEPSRWTRADLGVLKRIDAAIREAKEAYVNRHSDYDPGESFNPTPAKAIGDE